MTAGRLDVGIVGTGRVGAVLGSALRAVGHRVVAASATSEDSLERAATLLPGVPVLAVPDVVARADLVLLTVPDDQLSGLVGGLAATGAFRPGRIVAHTAGRFGCDVLSPAVEAGAIALAMHPATTFTGYTLDLARLQGCRWAVTAAAPVLPIAQALVVELGGEPAVLEESAREAYDAALTHASTHVGVVVAQAARVLADLGIEDPAALVASLARAGLDTVARQGEGSLPGPVARRDATTLAAHLAALDAAADDARFPDSAPGTGGGAPAPEADDALPGRSLVAARSLDDVPSTYRHLARVAVARAAASGLLRPDGAAELRDCLG